MRIITYIYFNAIEDITIGSVIDETDETKKLTKHLIITVYAHLIYFVKISGLYHS